MKGHVLLCGPAEPANILDNTQGNKLPIGLGGVPVNSLARALIAQGWKVTVVTTSKHVSEVWRYQSKECDISVLPFRDSPKKYILDGYAQERAYLTSEINLSGADIVHAHWTYEFALASLESNKPVLVTAHDSPLTVLKIMKDVYRLERYFLALKVRAQTRHLTAVSPILAADWHKLMMYRRPIPVIPNIVDVERIRQIPAAEKILSMNVTSVGSDNAIKNMKTLLKAWPIVLAAHPLALLNLVGPGLEVNGTLWNWAQNSDLNLRVNWIGLVAHTKALSITESSTVLAHPSLWESQGMTILEAMSAGVPVVAGHNAGAISSTLGDAGILIDTRSKDEMAAAINELLSDSHRAHELGRNGIARAHNYFSAARVVGLYESEYEKVLLT